MRYKILTVAFAAVLCGGCDDDDGPGGSGVPSDTNAQDLTYEELRLLCEWSNARTQDRSLSIEQVCTYKALDEADDDVGKCEELWS